MQPESSLSAGARNLLAQVREIFGVGNVTLTSTRRGASHNASIPGASRTSQHLSGDAFDFQVKGMTPIQVQTVIAAKGLTYGQSIAEFGAGMNPRNHLSTGTKGETLVANDGKYTARTIAADQLAKAKGFANAAVENTAGAGRKALNTFLGSALGNKISDELQKTGDALQKPADAVGLDGDVFSTDAIFKRVALVVFGLMFIGASLMILGKGSAVKQIVGKVPGIK